MKKNPLNRFLSGTLLLALLSTVSCKNEKDFGEPMTERFAISSVVVNSTPFDALDDTICLLYGKQLQLSCAILPANSSNLRLKWSSSNESVASVSQDGLIVAHNKIGAAIIRIAPEIGFGPSATTPSKVIKVVDVVTYVTSIQIKGQPTKDMYEGEKFQLAYTVAPVNATYPRCEWISSDPSVATIGSKGEVALLKAGTVTFIARSTDVQAVPNGNPAVEASYTLTVKASVPIENVVLTNEPLLSSLGYGQAYQLKYTLTPVDATAAMLTWSSSNESVVAVNDKGEIFVNARAAASAEITATAPNGRFSKLTVSVEAGRMCYSFANTLLPWTLGHSGTSVADGTKSIVTMVTPNKYRADLILGSSSSPVSIAPSVYKILAVKFRSNSILGLGNTANGAMSLDFTGAPANTWNNNRYEVLNGTRTPGQSAVVYYDLGAKLSEVLSCPTFQFKMADFPLADGNTYDLYWIRSFKSVADLQAFVDSE